MRAEPTEGGSPMATPAGQLEPVGEGEEAEQERDMTSTETAFADLRERIAAVHDETVAALARLRAEHPDVAAAHDARKAADEAGGDAGDGDEAFDDLDDGYAW